MLSKSVAVILAHPIDFAINTFEGFVRLAIEPYELQTGWQGAIANSRALVAIQLAATAFQGVVLAAIWIGVFRALWQRPRDWERWILLGAALMLILPPAIYAERDLDAISIAGNSFLRRTGGYRLATHNKFRTSMKTVVAALACIVALSWIYLLAGAGMPTMDMGGGQVMLMPPPSWSVGYAAITFLMWSIMMVAMMIPSATPTILGIASGAEGISRAAYFAIGYLVVWIGFSAVATAAQWAFDSAHLLSDSMAIRSGAVAGLIIVSAGLYQLSPLKENCLRHCCSSNLLDDPTRSPSLAIRAGLTYGVSCFGCCWALMCLLFVVGIMNLFWIAAITVWVLAEKTLPWGLRLARVTAVALIGWGSVAIAMGCFADVESLAVTGSRPSISRCSRPSLRGNLISHGTEPVDGLIGIMNSSGFALEALFARPKGSKCW